MANRAKFESEVRARLDESMNQEGFIVREFTTKIDPPASLTAAINAKNEAVQNALKAENKVKEAEAEAEEAPAESEEAAEADTDEAEGCDCGEDCGEGCGGGCSGCGPREPIYEGKNAGKTVKVHYRGTLNDGTEFDSSYGRGETLDFMCGMGRMIPGFDKAVVNMEVGEEIDIHLMPEEAYGPVNEESIFTIPIANLAGAEELEVGNRIYISGGGRPFPVTVTAKDAETITLDANHALAGQELNFHIQLVAVEERLQTISNHFN